MEDLCRVSKVGLFRFFPASSSFSVARIELTVHLIERGDANAIRIVEGDRPLETTSTNI